VTDQTKPKHILPDLVEPINRYLHVPLAAFLVAGLKKTPVTPNQVTYVSILFGLAAAGAFSRGSAGAMIAGGLLLEVTLILDCADGQLARAKNCSTEWGRLLDGIAGYIAYLAVVAGLLLGLQSHYGSLAVISLFTILRAISYDYCKQFMTSLVERGVDWSREDIEGTFLKTRQKTSTLAVVYFYYLQVQRLMFRGQFSSLAEYAQQPRGEAAPAPLPAPAREAWRKKFSTLAIFWKWHGADLVLFLFVLFAVTGTLRAFLEPMAWLLGVQFALTLMIHHFLIRHETAA